ncbi:MAG: hypothetical protein Q8903_12290 [Bacteroidota bacterium]|nr:hypothetical protein [Bacteroidota bacterium]
MNRSKNINASQEPEDTQDLFPSIIELEDLTEDSNLPAITILSANRQNNNAEIIIEFYYLRRGDIFIYRNNEKVDMYYQAIPGTYKFQKMDLSDGLNEFEIFYRIGNRKSVSAFISILKV